MNFSFLSFAWFFITVLLSCQQPPEESPRKVTQAYFSTGPKLVKIVLDDPADADRLIAQGVDVIVVEPDYVIAKLDDRGGQQITNMAMQMITFEEDELVQRLIEVKMRNNENLTELSNIGIDIWEVKGDTVVAQAFDKYIRQIQALGYELQIVEKNIQTMVQE